MNVFRFLFIAVLPPRARPKSFFPPVAFLEPELYILWQQPVHSFIFSRHSTHENDVIFGARFSPSACPRRGHGQCSTYFTLERTKASAALNREQPIANLMAFTLAHSGSPSVRRRKSRPLIGAGAKDQFDLIEIRSIFRASALPPSAAEWPRRDRSRPKRRKQATMRNLTVASLSTLSDDKTNASFV